MSNRVAIAITVGLVGLFWSLVSVHAEECGCKFQSARSRSSAGTCAVREDMARDCNLVWGSTSGVRETKARPAENELFLDLSRAAGTATAPNADTYVNGASQMMDPNFWQQFRSEVRSRSQLTDDRADTFDHALAFLANQGATSDFRQFALGAVIYITFVNLSEGQITPQVRSKLLLAIMGSRDKLTGFLSNGASPSLFSVPLPINLPDGTLQQAKMGAQVARGCLDIWVEEVKVSSLVKTQGSVTKGRRCD
ncbi:hypothetical protein [Bradyrhizobium sp. RT5a]|uniref:hypothetical protein n=1 Tax=unclassified Bradyrhizobium TaxID=2631580 RepID=UPI00339531F7